MLLGKIIWLKLDWWILDWWKVTGLQLWLQCSAAIAMALVAINMHWGRAGHCHCPFLGISCRAPRGRAFLKHHLSLWSLPTSSIWYSWKIQWKGWKNAVKDTSRISHLPGLACPDKPLSCRSFSLSASWQRVHSASQRAFCQCQERRQCCFAQSCPCAFSSLLLLR